MKPIEIAPTRLLWVDVARGIAIVLVAFYHADLFVAAMDVDPLSWWLVSDLLRTLRMPLFFLVSGVLAARAVDRPWPVLRQQKFVVWLWLYVVWSALSLVTEAVVPHSRGGGEGLRWTDFSGVVLWPTTGLWYLYALAAFMVVVRLTRRLPAPLVVGVAAVLAVVVGEQVVETGNFAWDNMCMFLVFFVVGARGAGLVTGVAQRLTGRDGWLVVLVYGVLAGGLVAVTYLAPERGVWDLPGLRPALSVLAAAAGVGLAVLLAPTALGRSLAFLGRNTLPIYVAHELLLGLVTTALSGVLEGTGGGGPGLLWPFPLTVVVIGATLLVHRALRDVPGLYAPPSWLERLVGPRTAGADPGAPVPWVAGRGSR